VGAEVGLPVGAGVGLAVEGDGDAWDRRTLERPGV
jgi:hypothetical protein